MRNFLFFILLVFLICCETTSDINTSKTLIVAQVIVLFEIRSLEENYGGDIDVMAQMLSKDGKLIWEQGVRNKVISTSSNYLEHNIKALPDGAGYLVVIFEFEALSNEYAGDSDIFAQKISSDGNSVWNRGEVPSPVASSKWNEKNPVLVPDDQGGVIVIFECHAPAENKFEGDIDIRAQKISGTGKKIWEGGEKSVVVATSTNFLERNPKAISDGQGGAFIVFESQVRSGEYKGDIDIYAQHINANGKLLWNEGKESLIVATSTWQEKNPSIIPDTEGGFIIVYESHAPSESEFAGDVDIRAQRISASGSKLWGKEGRDIMIANSSARELNPQVITDAQGGAFIVFEAETRGDNTVKRNFDIYAQRINAQGQLIWNNGERPIAISTTGFSEKNPVIVSDSSYGFIVFFEVHPHKSSEYYGDIDIKAQHISAQGEKLWGENKNSVNLATSDYLEYNPHAVPDGKGGAIVIFEYINPFDEIKGNSNIGAQYIDTNGNILWNKGRMSLVISATQWAEKNPVIIPFSD